MKRVFSSVPISCSLDLILGFLIITGGHDPTYTCSLKESNKQKLQCKNLSNLCQLKGVYIY
jgi:hypothetical protein